ncbi:hypothetical protein [Clostridium oryzae]|uniref:Uncharacterized protein n=1 Tax=Clostridium oryzae TaxID=1450648 RepID=A0A1V4ILE3_9CLOT|nr:hypothetical protein [Clostridium oryzae]OPJ60679.1 hypothetical protein CLORY_27300 [Clostridium oryzae]
MSQTSFRRPTKHYDERIKGIDEKICELIKQRKEVSSNDPGYPPLEVIKSWAEKYDLYEDLLNSIFGTLWDEESYKPNVKPEDFKKQITVLKAIEANNKIYSVACILQYSNSSVVNLNIEWDSTNNRTERRRETNHYELYIDKDHECRMFYGSGGDDHSHNSFVVSPPLPDDVSGINLIFKERNFDSKDWDEYREIVISL